MRKILAVCLLVFVLVGCQTDGDSAEEKANNEDEQTDTSGQDKDASETTVAQSPIEKIAIDHELVDEDNYLDEREMLVEAILRQKDLLKLGFVNDEVPFTRISSTYYPLTDSSSYDALYELPNFESPINYQVYSDMEEEFFQDLLDGFTDGQKIDHPTLEGFHGKNELGYEVVYEVLGTDDQFYYMLSTGTEEDGYNEEIIELLSLTMKTEADGAYDPLYDHFKMDLDLVKFPQISKEHANISNATVTIGHNDDSYVILKLIYEIGEDSVLELNVLENKENDLNLYADQEGNKETTEGGTVVLINEDDDEDYINKSYYWTDGVHKYSLYLDEEKEHLSDEDILTLIDSSSNDERTFENIELFNDSNTELVYSDNEQKLFDLLMK